MRITALTNGRDSYKLKHFLDTLSQLFIALVAVIVDLQNFKDLIFHSQHRIQAGHRILKDHRDLLAADAPHFILFQFQKVLSVKENLSSFYLADSVRQKPHDCQSCRRLSCSGFSYQPQCLLRTYPEADSIHRMDSLLIRLIYNI